MQNKNNFVWIDLEMTGLDPDQDKILEIATIITDPALNILHEGPMFAIHQPEEVIRAMNGWCKEQHISSGLIQAVQQSSHTVQEAEKETLDVIKKYCKPGMGMLAGNSVWSDRSFLRKYMPNLLNYLHYKLIDVTSIQQLIQAWYPDNPQSTFAKKDNHRALSDIQESIAELIHYRKYFFNPK